MCLLLRAGILYFLFLFLFFPFLELSLSHFHPSLSQLIYIAPAPSLLSACSFLFYPCLNIARHASLRPCSPWLLYMIPPSRPCTITSKTSSIERGNFPAFQGGKIPSLAKKSTRQKSISHLVYTQKEACTTHPANPNAKCQ
ncbi:hypothetical protein QBC36DRAFT_35559 [Triangularia setosa]|uniref:Uncharacterized protein n=1 Tax=Triangularia setosa TaxID=2587417 RepID=A0AAN7A452_9PEZI|nr:hypothetical protein QBC36DRAFT_35559 [Podospora setosa]